MVGDDPTDGGRLPVSAWLVAVPVLLLAFVSALLTPLMGLSDEPAHAIHAVGVVHGTLAGDDEVRTDPTSGWTRTETAVPVPSAYADLPDLPTCFAFEPTVAADCAPAVDDAAGRTVTAASTVGTYAPWWYAVVGWPSRVLDPAPALYAMRALAALVFGALVAVAAVSLWRVGARRWGTVGLLLALPPAAIHLAGGINPSGTEIAAAVALWAASVELVLGTRSRAAVARWVVAGSVVALVRALGPAITVGIPVLVALAFVGRPDVPWRTRPVRRGTAVVAAAAAVGLAWSAWRGTLSAFSGFPQPGATGLTAIRRSLALIPERLVEMVGVLGWADVTLPKVLVAGWLLAIVGLVGVALWAGDARVRSWLVALGLVVLLLPIAADLRSAPEIGFVWQGRYTLPIAAGLPLLAGAVLDRWPPAADRRARGMATVVTVLLAVGHVVALVAVGRRFGTGIDASVVTAVTDASWQPPLPIGALVVVGVVAAVALVLAQRNGQGTASGEMVDRR